MGNLSFNGSSLDLIQTLILLGITALVALAYGIRVLIKGKAKFERVEKQGGSALLNKELMQMVYWSVQPVARLLIFLKITANQLTWTALVFGIASGVCLAFGHFGFGAIFHAVAAILDALDGMVARLQGGLSGAGSVLDSAMDRYVEFFFLAGLAIHYRAVPVLLILVLFAILGSFMVSYSTAKAEALSITPPRGSMRRPERAVYFIVGAALSPITIPWLEVHREFGIAIGHPMVLALGLVAVMSNVSAIERFWATAKAVRLREEEAKDAAQKALNKEDHFDDHHSSSSIHPLKPRL